MENNAYNDNFSISQYSEPVQQVIKEAFEEYKSQRYKEFFLNAVRKELLPYVRRTKKQVLESVVKYEGILSLSGNDKSDADKLLSWAFAELSREELEARKRNGRIMYWIIVIALTICSFTLGFTGF